MTANDPKDDPIAESAPRRGRPAWLQTLFAIPATVLPLLPSFSCPVCVAAYAGLLSSVGLGFLLTDRIQRPLIVAFLIVSVTGVGWAARQYKRVGPFVLVILGSTGIIAGRLVWSVTPALYIGVVCLVAGTVWNLILKRPRRRLAAHGVRSDAAHGEFDSRIGSLPSRSRVSSQHLLPVALAQGVHGLRYNSVPMPLRSSPRYGRRSPFMSSV